MYCILQLLAISLGYAQIPDHKNTFAINDLSYYNHFVQHYESGSLPQNFYIFQNKNERLAISPTTDIILKKAFQQNYGLSINSSYIDNFSNGIGDLGIFYNRAFQTGLEWNIFKDGYLDKKKQYPQQLAQYQLKINKVNQLLEKNQLISNTFVIDSIYALVTQIHLQHYANYLTLKKNTYSNLYTRRLCNWTELITINNDETNLKLKISPYTHHQSEDSLFKTVINAKIYNIKKLHTLPAIVDSSQYWSTKAQNIEQHFLQQISLKTSLRYNYFNYDSKSLNRDFLSVGINLNIPLFSRYKEINALNQFQQKLEQQQFETERLAQKEKLKNLVQQYNQALTPLINVRYNSLIIKEKIRKELIKKEKGDLDFSSIAVLNHTHDLYKNIDAYLIYKKELDLCAAQIAKIVGVDSFINCQEEIPISMEKPQQQIESEAIAQNNHENAIYIWSKTFKALSIDQIIANCKSAQANKAIISINMENELKVKLLEFIKTAKKQQIKTVLMIGKNNLIYPNQQSELLAEINYLLEVPDIDEIHLDIEPHTMNELKKNRTKYMNWYLQMLRAVHQELSPKNIKITISIPLFYDEKFLKDIFKLTNQVYLMTYEHTDIEFIKRKIKEEIGVDESKVVLAVRNKDFQSKSALLSFIAQLKQQTNIKKFAIHDLNSWHLTY
jgi:hypothetical protein